MHRWPTVAQIARQQLGWRMRAMPYLYTAFFDSSQYGCPVMRPLFFAFPADENIYSPSNTQFLIGDGLMINPVTVVRGCFRHLDAVSTVIMQLPQQRLPAQQLCSSWQSCIMHTVQPVHADTLLC